MSSNTTATRERGPRVIVPLSPSLDRLIDEVYYRKRLRSRADAARCMMIAGADAVRTIGLVDGEDRDDEPLSERLVVPVSDDLLQTIDDIHFGLRYPNRSAAIRALIREGSKELEASATPTTALIATQPEPEPEPEPDALPGVADDTIGDPSDGLHPLVQHTSVLAPVPVYVVPPPGSGWGATSPANITASAPVPTGSGMAPPVEAKTKPPLAANDGRRLRATGRTEQLNVRATLETKALLDRLASTLDSTASAVVEAAIKEYAERHLPQP